jgi:hypothetical protein
MFMNRRKNLSILVFSILVLLSFGAAFVGAQDLGFMPLGQKPQHHKLESVLDRLYLENEKSSEDAERFAKQRDIKIKNAKVTVFLYSETGNSEDIDKITLKRLGAEFIKQGDSIMKVDVPIKKLKKIADEVPGISFIRQPDKPISLLVSEGVNLTGASSYHSSGYTGSGVNIAVIDLEFAGLLDAYYAGEIPGSAVPVDCTGAGCVSTSFPAEAGVHGVAVAEIVNDMAPGSQLYLIKVDDSLDLIDAKNYCVTNGVRIVNHSVGWVNQNFYDGSCFNDNPVCTVNNAYSNGILWVNSAGNSAQKHYSATFTDPDSDGLHNVSGNVETINFYAYAGYPIIISLTWNAWPTTNQDYDLCLYDASYNLIDCSATYQTGSQPPTEQILISAASYTGNYYIGIWKYYATTNHRLEVQSFTPFATLNPYVAAGSLLCPADATGAFAVAAINHANWLTGPQEPFSSQGPTNDGRTKPEISGPDMVSTLSYGVNGFSGTSASAPHVAGAAALVLSANPSYSVSQLWNALTGSAINMGSPGQDNIYGFGRLNMPTVAVPVTITTSPSGRQITVDGTPYTAPQTFNWTPGSSHTIGVSSPQSGGAETRYLFSSWSDGGGQSHSISAPVSPATYTAYFTTQYQLTTSVNPPGSGSVNPNCSGGCWYNSGAQFDLTATPGSGYTFSTWSGSISSILNPLTVNMDSPKSITANFASVPGTLQIVSVDGFASSGEQGGPFSPSNKQYTLSNIGNSTINWTASNGQEWLGLSSAGGTLAAGANTIVTVSVNNLSNSLTPGTYHDTVTFTNTTNGNGNTTRPILLQVNINCDDIILDGSFEEGTPNPSWTETSTHYGTPLCTVASCGNGGGTVSPRTGSWWVWFGGVGEFEEGSVSQTITIPANNTATLQFHLWNGTSSGNGVDNFKVLIDGSELFVMTEGAVPYTSGYTEVTLDLTGYADGNPHTLSFQSTTTGPDITNFSLDDVSLTVCPSTMGGISGVVTDGSSGIQRVSVRVLDAINNVVSSTSTDVNGHYTVANIPEGNYKVQFKACARGYMNEWYNDKTDFSSADDVSVSDSNTTAGINADLSESFVTFTDIPSGFWAESYIKALYCEGITTGYTDGTYRPSQNVSRAQMAAFIVRAKFGEDFSYSSTQHFSDIPDTHWAFKYVQKMYDEGITTGYPDGTYRPSENVSRAQMATFIIRALFGDLFIYTSDAYFSDVPDTHWAFKYVQKMYDEGITTGYADGTYRPSQNVSRAQMATFIARAFLWMP